MAVTCIERAVNRPGMTHRFNVVPARTEAQQTVRHRDMRRRPREQVPIPTAAEQAASNRPTTVPCGEHTSPLCRHRGDGRRDEEQRNAEGKYWRYEPRTIPE